MTKNQETKAGVVQEIKAKWDGAQSVLLIDYRGLTVAEDTELRRKFREAGVEYQVLKNTLISLAVKDSDVAQEIIPFLSGPTAVAFCTNDAVAPAKVFAEFNKAAKKMTFKVGVVDGKVIDERVMQALATIPSKDVLVAKMLGSMNAPITNFVGVLSATVRSLVYTLAALRDQKDDAA